MFSLNTVDFAPNHPEAYRISPCWEAPVSEKYIVIPEVKFPFSGLWCGLLVSSHPQKNCYIWLGGGGGGWEGVKIVCFHCELVNRGIRNLGRGKLIWWMAAKKLRQHWIKRSFQTCIWCCWNSLHTVTHPLLCYTIPQRLIPISLLQQHQLHKVQKLQ